MTVNDYLARRDSEWVGQVHRFLGLEVGLIQANMDSAGRYKAHHADVTYVTNSEIGFGRGHFHKIQSQILVSTAFSPPVGCF